MNTADVIKILDAVSNAAGVLKTVAETPGVNMIPYATTVSTAIGALQAAYEAGKNIAPYVEAIAGTFSGEGIPSEDDIAALDAKIAALEAKVAAPLPPREEGEPE